ncbi:hypothetical protein [Phytoactinopolyspora mesophila]|uniref:hypothetical protein n=1 Tax=Phytoactinopolyspora mesophila TaxID=2650750 RepID=UPI001FEAFD55|nr:hypothetical protein [Phytoactinopolyspora mesophila]
MYCERAAWEASASSSALRHAIEVWAAILALGRRGWASGYSAALLLGLPVPKGQPEGVEISLPQRFHGRRGYRGMRVRTASVAKGDVFVLRGVPMTVPARTSLDITRNHGFPAGLIVADAALRNDVVRPGELDEMVEGMKGWRKSSQMRLVAEHASRTRESPGESFSYAVFVIAEFPLPECNAWVVGEGHGGVRSDFLWRRHRLVGEVDGHLKYRDPLWGPPERVLLDEKKRQMRIEEAGFVVVRWTPAEAVNEPGAVLHRIVRQSTIAARMFGVPCISMP